MCFVLFGVARMFLWMSSSQANWFFLWARVLSRPFKIVGENSKLRKESNWGHTWQLVPSVLSRLFRLAEINRNILYMPFFNWSVRCPGKKSQNNKSIMKQLDGVFIPFNAISFNILHHPGWTVRFTCLIQARAYTPGKCPLFGTGGKSSWLVKGTKSYTFTAKVPEYLRNAKEQGAFTIAVAGNQSSSIFKGTAILMLLESLRATEWK